MSGDFGESRALSRSSCVVAAWGTKGTLFERDKQVLKLTAHWQNIHCLGVTKDGHPRHPLYVKGDVGLISLAIRF
ncbi:MAG TPA: DUF1643 domain-containing protein [Ktedonobacteraceae bacterium]|nr:DUF1643 domain-containing protein [Ktedonobacteraceae bacterium]